MSSRPRTPDLAVSRHALLAEAFEILGNSLGPLVEERMARHFEDHSDWTAEAANRMGRADEHGLADPLFQLLVLRRFWGPVFGEFFGTDLRGLIGQLIEARNLWAHFSLPSDTGYLDRILLAIERLVAPVNPEQTTYLRSIRTRLKNPLSGDAIAENKPTAQAGNVAPSVDTTGLTTQQRQTEAAFEDLQRRYGQLSDQLSAARKVAAGKQLRLSASESKVARLADETTMLEQRIELELMTRARLEWLFVGFISVMVLVILMLGV